MSYDEDLANRIRELVGAESGLTEKRMFGGLAFLIDGNMSVAARGRGGMMVRVGPLAADAAAARPHADHAHMGERRMTGWIVVEQEGVRTKRQLSSWVGKGVAYARSLPPKG